MRLLGTGSLTFVAVILLSRPYGTMGWGCEESDEGSSSDNITITGDDHKFPTGHDIELKCETVLNTTVQWTDSDGLAVQNSTDDRITIIDGVFAIKNAQVNDTDTYYCRSGQESQSYFLCVYVMPTYLKEGIIILTVLGFLMVIFCVCLIYTQIKEKREAKGRYKDIPDQQYEVSIPS